MIIWYLSVAALTSDIRRGDALKELVEIARGKTTVILDEVNLLLVLLQ